MLIGKISGAPQDVRALVSEEADYLLSDLEQNKIKITLIPAPCPMFTGHLIRSVESKNPSWYSSLYHAVGINRAGTKAALARIVAGEWKPVKHDAAMLELITDRLGDGYEQDDGYFVEPDPAARKYFFE